MKDTRTHFGIFMQDFIQTWGYIAVFLGSLVEGESVILTAGFLAHEGYLSLPKIIAVSFMGTLIADQLLYFLGRAYGERILDRLPKLREKAIFAFQLLHKWDALFMMSFRFIYGIRVISPIVIGMGGISPGRFAIFNVLAAAVWAILSCSAGYLLGHIFMDQLDLLPKIILGIAVVVGLGIYLYFRFRKKNSLQKS